MPLARALGRFAVIVGSAVLAAAGAGAAWMVGLAVQDLIWSQSPSQRALGQIDEMMLGIGVISATYIGPVVVIPALIILWGTVLERAVPFTAAVTLAVAMVCGMLPWPKGIGGMAVLASILITLVAGVFAMISSSASWPLDHRRRGRKRIDGAPDAIGTSAAG